jgi:hypothetical protein
MRDARTIYIVKSRVNPTSASLGIVLNNPLTVKFEMIYIYIVKGTTDRDKGNRERRSGMAKYKTHCPHCGTAFIHKGFIAGAEDATPVFIHICPKCDRGRRW